MQRVVTYDVVKMRQDMAAKGWQPVDLAGKAKVAASSVTRFFNGSFQTHRMGKRLARALGHGPDHYLIRSAQLVREGLTSPLVSQ